MPYYSKIATIKKIVSVGENVEKLGSYTTLGKNVKPLWKTTG